MSIIDSFDPNSDSLVNPIKKKQKNLNYPKIAIACFDQKLINTAIKHYPHKKIDQLFAGFNFPVYEISFKNIKVALYLSILGAPATTNFLELLQGRGIENFIFMGGCGILDENLLGESIIVPTSSFRDEGVSYHYQKSSDFIDIKDSEKLQKILSKMKVHYQTSVNWTTDAIFRETKNNINNRKLSGCTTVDMEASAIHSVCAFRKIHAFQFFWPLDLLMDDKRQILKPSKSEKEYIDLALEISTFI